MANQQLIDYIKSQLSKNIELIQIKQTLFSKGWADNDINEAINSAQNVTNPSITGLQQINEEKPKKLKLWIFIIAIILIIIGFFIVNKNNRSSETKTTKTQIPANSSKSTVIADCGSSDSCFSNYVKTCTLSKATISDQGLTYVETIGGYEGNDCLLTLVYTQSPVPGFVGREMTCKVPKSNLTNFKDYLQGEKMKQSCKGPLLDSLMQMGAQ